MNDNNDMQSEPKVVMERSAAVDLSANIHGSEAKWNNLLLAMAKLKDEYEQSPDDVSILSAVAVMDSILMLLSEETEDTEAEMSEEKLREELSAEVEGQTQEEYIKAHVKLCDAEGNSSGATPPDFLTKFVSRVMSELNRGRVWVVKSTSNRIIRILSGVMYVGILVVLITMLPMYTQTWGTLARVVFGAFTSFSLLTANCYIAWVCSERVFLQVTVNESTKEPKLYIVPIPSGAIGKRRMDALFDDCIVTDSFNLRGTKTCSSFTLCYRNEQGEMEEISLFS